MSNYNEIKKTLCDVHIETIKEDSVEPSRFLGGDLDNGKYRNYVLLADYSDPNVIRVGDDYYAVSSTFHLEPGITIMHSKDLVNWKIIGHAIKDLKKLSHDF